MIDFSFLFEAMANGCATAIWFVILSKFRLLPVLYVEYPKEDNE